MDPSGHEGLICSKKYGELKKKETEGGTLSEKEKQQMLRLLLTLQAKLLQSYQNDRRIRKCI